jgi:hypothetical protein
MQQFSRYSRKEKERTELLICCNAFALFAHQEKKFHGHRFQPFQVL